MPNQNPDLQIFIRQSSALGRTKLSFEVRASNLSPGLNFAEFGPVILKSDPEAYARAWGKDIRGLFSSTRDLGKPQNIIEDNIAAEHRLAGKGATMFKELLPEGLQHLL